MTTEVIDPDEIHIQFIHIRIVDCTAIYSGR